MTKLKSLMAAICTAASICATPALADDSQVGVNYHIMTSPFAIAYDRYIKSYAKQYSVNILSPVDSNQDSARQITDISNLLNIGAKSLVIEPIDSAAIGPALKQAAKKNIPVITVDVAPDKGPVTMVVRADNRAYGEKACQYIGANVKEGKVIQIMGNLTSINGRDRTEAFNSCIKKNFPKITILDIPAQWKSAMAASGLDSLLPAHPDVKGIYMQAGGTYLSATMQALKRHGMLFPYPDPKHIVIVSNDGIPQELEGIKKGEIDATVSQPADLYAKYGLLYAKESMEGKKFAAGPTDHDSTIVEVGPGILEDRLPAPLVTRENVDDKALWGNQL